MPKTYVYFTVEDVRMRHLLPVRTSRGMNPTLTGT